jgi:protein TonB
VKDRWTHAAAFLIALALHVLLLAVATRQYVASATKPQQLNQAVQRLAVLNGQPVRFVYVKDMVPNTQPPLDPTRLSDMNRRGASPDPRKGDSPDPTSHGHNSLRQIGGEGNDSVTRPSAMPSPSSPQPIAGRQGAGQGETPGPTGAQSRAGRNAKPSSNAERQPGAGTGAQALGQPAEGDRGLPVGGEQPAMTSVSPGSTGQRPAPLRPGLGTALQQMMTGSLQGGYSNPNASRLNTGSLSFDTAGWDLGPYARKVQERVQSNWHVPEAQVVLRQKGWVAIRFEVYKDGSIRDLQVVRASGVPSYDQSALDALRSSDPLPPLPNEVTVPKISGLFRFYYNIQEDD